jgi:hypothetical protein
MMGEEERKGDTYEKNSRNSGKVMELRIYMHYRKRKRDQREKTCYQAKEGRSDRRRDVKEK